jgi:hypothetical protein
VRPGVQPTGPQESAPRQGDQGRRVGAHSVF